MNPRRPVLRAVADAPAGDVTKLSAATIAADVAAGRLSAEDVVGAHLGRVAEVEPDLHSLVRVDPERAFEQARAIDECRRRGEPVGPLAGVPFVVKDNIDVSGQTTASGSRAHDGVVALRDATVVSRMIDAGAIPLGRANMDELAMGASTQTSAFGATRNPWDARRSPGGSSGGSAAAVSACLATVSLGSDTGGSIREPAAQCGVVGMAPTHGLVPTDGVVPFAPELDRVGPIARNVEDTALLLDVLTGRPAGASAGRPPRRVGVIAEFDGDRNQPGVLERFALAREVVRASSVEVVTVSVPDALLALTAYMHLTSAACVPLMEPYVRTGQAGDEVLRRYRLGVLLRGADRRLLANARAVQRRLIEQTRAALARCDVLFAPTMPTTAPLLTAVTDDERDSSLHDMADPLHAPYTDCWTVLANLTGLSSLSVPFGESAADGMPVGMMLAGAGGSDAMLLALAERLEQRAGR